MKTKIFKIMTMLILTFTLSSCVSLKPQKNIETKNQKANTIKEIATEISEIEKEIEKIKNIEKPEFNLSAFKSNIKLEVLNNYDSHKDDFLFKRYNTIFSSRPYRSVYLVRLTGDYYISESFLDIKGFINEEQVMFDFNMLSGNILGQPLILEFMEPISKEQFDKINFVIDVALPTENKNEIVIAPTSYDIKDYKSIPIHGQPFKIEDNVFGIWDTRNSINNQGDLNSGYIYNVSPKLSVFGKDVNIDLKDIDVSLKIDGKEEKIKSDDISMHSTLNNEIINEDVSNKARNIQLSINALIPYEAAENKKVEFRIKVKNSQPLIIELNQQQ